MNAGTMTTRPGCRRCGGCSRCVVAVNYGLAEVQGRDGEAFAIGIILVVIGVILAILAAPAPAIAGRRHFL